MTTNIGALRTTGKLSRFAWIASVCALVILTGCGGKKDRPASQTAAKVNKEEITVHQINFVLQQQRGLKPEQADAASHQVLERLIDQELAVQKAEDMKLDRDPRVQQQLEAARREIIARAYAERVSDSVAKPTPEEIQKYYEDKPALFKDRHVYNIQELQIEAKPEEMAEIKAKAEAAKSATEVAEYLKSRDVKFTGNQYVRTPEQLPPQALQIVSQMKEGQVTVHPTSNGGQVIFLVGERPAPVSLQQATPLIEQMIVGERRRDVVARNLQELRREAKVEYVGKFQGGAPTATAAASEAAAAVGTSGTAAQAAPAEATAQTAQAAEAPSAPAAPASAGSGALDNNAITKGMGIK
jgi:EpsD family peptidyl-prolyl cis-trans isomerase